MFVLSTAAYELPYRLARRRLSGIHDRDLVFNKREAGVGGQESKQRHGENQTLESNTIDHKRASVTRGRIEIYSPFMTATV